MTSLLFCKEKGFTFIEVMVALSVLAIVITAVFRLYTQSVSMLILSDFDVKAPLLAQEVIADHLGKEDPVSDQGSFEDYPGYKWQMSIEQKNLENISSEESLKSIKFTRVTVKITGSDRREFETFFHVF